MYGKLVGTRDCKPKMICKKKTKADNKTTEHYDKWEMDRSWMLPGSMVLMDCRKERTWDDAFDDEHERGKGNEEEIAMGVIQSIIAP